MILKLESQSCILNLLILLISQLKIFDAASGGLDGSFDTGDNNFYSFFGAAGPDGRIYSVSNSVLYAIDD